MSRTSRIIAVAALAMLIAGCGTRGPLEPPPGAQADPQSDSLAGPEPDPDPPFVLDKII